MKRAAAGVTVILKGILFIGFSIQMIMGIVWMCFNFIHLQDFGEPEGILYPVLRNVLGGAYPLLYLIQLCAAFFAAHLFLQSLFPAKGFIAVWRALVLQTFPMAMQCHLALSPHSLVSSFLLLETALAIRLCRDRERFSLYFYAGEGLCWLVLTLLLPEYLVLGGVLFLLTGAIGAGRMLRRHQKRQFGSLIVMFAACLGMVCGSVSLSARWENPFGQEELALSAFSRFAWQNMWNDLGEWPQEVPAALGEQTMEIAGYADNVRLIMKPIMDENFGTEEKIEYYLRMAESGWRMHSSVVIRQMGWDALGYGITPLILPLQLQGRAYDSYSGRNYEFMINHTPVLTSRYVRYSCLWFGWMLAVTAFLWIMNRIAGLRPVRRWGLPGVLLCLFTFGLTVVWYTMRGAGVMDYKCTVAVNLFWLAAALTVRQRGSEDGTEKA